MYPPTVSKPTAEPTIPKRVPPWKIPSSTYHVVLGSTIFRVAEFPSLYGYVEFQKSVRQKFRYIHDDAARKFIEAVLDSSASRAKILPKDGILYRAQRGFRWRLEHGVEVETAFGPERMVPKAELVGDGRVNAAKIPCLYLATNPNTAMAEVRPWLGSRISLAEFKVMQDCRIVDCSSDEKRSWEFSLRKFRIDDLGTPPPEPTSGEKEAGVWGDIAHAFSEPVSVDEPGSDYVPTQILAEAFRQNGYEGIMYKSLLDQEGKNIALFDVASAELLNCCLYVIDSVTFKFSQEENPYFIPKHYSGILKSMAK